MDPKPDILMNPAFRWNRQTLTEFAKDAFRNFKSAWRAQVDEDKASRKRVNEQTNRWMGRHKEVSS